MIVYNFTMIRDLIIVVEVIMSMRGEKGFSITSLVMAAGIIGIISVATAQMFKSQSHSQAESDMRMSHLTIIRHLINNMNCSATATSLPALDHCNSDNKPIEIRSKQAGTPVLIKSFDPQLIQPWMLNDQTVTAGQLTEVANHYVAAVCNAAGEIKIFAKKIRGIPPEFKAIKPDIPWGCRLPAAP